MNFYVLGYREELPARAIFPCIRLNTDNWNDYGIKTLFHMLYCESHNNCIEIGDIKIMQEGEPKTVLPQYFKELSEDYCSLGQSIDFYNKIREIFHENYNEILGALNDAAINPSILEKYENSREFKVSLLRWSEANKALRQGRSTLENIPLEKAFRFTFSCLLENAEESHKVKFNFRHVENIPNRIIALVGRNGTGKTQFLCRMAISLSGQNPYSKDKFEPHRPPFSKVIAVSYSAFDKFIRPKSDRSFSYKYCGLKDDKGFISQKKLIEIYKESVQRILDLHREVHWKDILGTIIDPYLLAEYYRRLFEERNYEIISRDKSLLSSGQSILMYVVTEIIANIREESLILFDEPEMHLHPNAIANLIRMLHLLLDNYNSLAILATHSPIIIQEVPSEYVFVFDREGNIPIIRKLPIESFGENISIITQHVFDTIDVKGTYRDVLERIANELSYKQINEIFKNKLSFNAKIYLKGLYNNEDTASD